MTKPNEIPCPECDKMLAISDNSHVIGEFLEWLLSECGLCLAEHDGVSGRLVPVFTRIEDLLAEYFEIDLKKVEQERRALLESLQADQKGND